MREPVTAFGFRLRLPLAQAPKDAFDELEDTRLRSLNVCSHPANRPYSALIGEPLSPRRNVQLRAGCDPQMVEVTEDVDRLVVADAEVHGSLVVEQRGMAFTASGIGKLVLPEVIPEMYITEDEDRARQEQVIARQMTQLSSVQITAIERRLGSAVLTIEEEAPWLDAHARLDRFRGITDPAEQQEWLRRIGVGSGWCRISTHRRGGGLTIGIDLGPQRARLRPRRPSVSSLSPDDVMRR